MFAVERIKIIKNHLIKEQKVSTGMLSELLDVSEVTIRRDLEKLEHEGFLERTHGGAVLLSYVEEDIVENETDLLYSDQRREIADTAFHLIPDGDTLMLTDGLTNLQIAKRLKDRSGLTVLTNDLRIASEFAGTTTNNVIMLGGDLEGYATYGQMVADNMKNFYFNHLFIEVDGISAKAGMTVSSIKKATLIQNAMHLAECVAVITVSKSFGEKALYRVGPMNLAKKVITDANIPDYYKDYIFNLNIPLYTSIDLYED